MHAHAPPTSAPSAPRLGLALAFAAGLAVSFHSEAAAADKPERRGGEVGVLLGGSGCIPARGDCRFDAGQRTRGSFGLGVDLGWRAHKAFFLGAGYSIGWFTPTWKLADSDAREYRNAYQQGAYLVLRAIIPIWRIDLGFEISPGWSQATFVAEGSETRHLSRGFSLRPGASIDFRVGRRLYLGARVDVPLAFHSRFCTTNASRVCGNQPTIDQLPIHQVIGGVHFGANF